MAIQTINFGNFEPDLPDIFTQGTSMALNVIPHQNCYLPFKSISTDTDALTAFCRGAVAYSDGEGNTEVFAGDETKLYRLSGTTFSSVGGSTYSSGDESYWEFAKFGQQVIATNFDNNIQVRGFGASGSFADLGGSPPKAKTLCISRGFLVLGNVNDGTHRPNRIQWSGLENITSWGSNPDTQSDFQDLQGDGGKVQMVMGGDTVIIFQERAIWEMEYIGSPLVWRLTNTIVNMGTPAARSVVRYGDSCFFYSQDGFMRYDLGGRITRIGDKKVDLFFAAREQTTRRFRMVSEVDVPNAKVVWSYCTGEGDPTELIIYDIKTDSWSFVQIDHQIIYFGRSQGFTLEGLDSINSSLDALPASLDADLYKGGQLALFVFDTNNKSGTFNGSALTARIETGEVATEDMEFLFCDRVRPLVTGANATNTVYLATRDSLNSDFTYSSGQTVNSIGEHNFRKSARYIRFRVDIAGGFDEAIGVRANLDSRGRR